MLGFKVKTSAPYGRNERWLTVVSPEDPDGVELVLHLTDEPARAYRAATRSRAGRSSPDDTCGNLINLHQE